LTNPKKVLKKSAKKGHKEKYSPTNRTLFFMTNPKKVLKKSAKKVLKENIHHRLENIFLFDKSQEGSQRRLSKRLPKKS